MSTNNDNIVQSVVFGSTDYAGDAPASANEDSGYDGSRDRKCGNNVGCPRTNSDHEYWFCNENPEGVIWDYRTVDE